MLDWLKKKTPAYPVESRWSVHNAEHQGRPMFLRRNDSAMQLAGHPEFGFRIGVAVPLNSVNDRGLPGNAEMEQLTAIEDALTSRLEVDQQSLQVLAITTGGMREFVFYTRNPAAMQAAVEAVRSEVQSHKLQSYIAKDPKWDMFKQFA